MLYHDNLHGVKYENFKLSNNWNPDNKYGENEYIRVYFRIDTYKFDYHGFFETDKDRFNFYEDVERVFKSIGWSFKSQVVANGNENLYIHPQEFSGLVRKNNVKVIAEILENNKTFTCNWVDLYEDYFDLSDSDYVKYLDARKDSIVSNILYYCKTTRKTKFYRMHERYSSKKEIRRIKPMAKNYYWLDTMPTWTTKTGALALICGEYNDDGQKDRESEKVILNFTEEDIGADRDADYPEWDKIDAYIKKELGFLPDYEVN